MMEAEHLAYLAARSESYPRLWERRFRGLLSDGVLSFSHAPAAEAGLRLHAIPVAADPMSATHFLREHLATAARTGQSVGVDVSAVDASGFSDWLATFARRCAAGPESGLLISTAADHAGALDLLRLRELPEARRPRIAFRLSAPDSGSGRPPDHPNSHAPGHTRGKPWCWHELVRASHRDTGIEIVPAGQQRLSLLHRPERDSCVMPLGVYQAAADTAWLTLDIDATRLGSPRQIRRSMAEILRFADNLIEATEWPRPALAVDALVNRRVAVYVHGLGDLLLARAVSPGDVTGFVWLKRWLGFVRGCLLHESALLARQRGPFPGCGANELIAELTPRYGAEGARRLLRHRFLRHRHLLALSPFALFPREKVDACPGRWLDLLPALACADVLMMRGSGFRKDLSHATWERLLHMSNMLDAMRGAITHKRLR